MRKILILCLVIAWSFTGCYEDKGDYDYRELAHVTIGNVESQYGASVGDTIIIKPEITLDIEAKVGLKYEWSVKLDSVFSREKDVEYIVPVDAPERMEWVLQVTDTLSGLTVMAQTMVNVRSLYSDGFLILSEKNGVSSLSFLKRTNEGEWDRCIYDIYEGIEGVSLDGKPVQIHLHNLGPSTDEHVMLLQDDFYKCMDLNANNLEKSLELSKEFQVIPENIKLKQAYFDVYFSFLLDEDGRVFARKNFSLEAFHTGYFSQYPLVYSQPVGEEVVPHELKVDRFVYDMNTENGYVFVYEKEYKRFLYIRGYSSYGTIGEPGVANYPDGFIRLDNLGDNELIATSGYWWNDRYIPAGGLFNIIKRPDGSYVGQMFTTDRPEDIQAVSQRKFKGDMMNDNVLLLIPDNGGGRDFGCPYAFLASGNVLYYFGKDDDAEEIIPKRYYGFPAEITTIEDEWYSNSYLCVGLANGEVYLLDISQGTGGGFASDEAGRLVMKMDKNVGRVKQIIHKKAE